MSDLPICLHVGYMEQVHPANGDLGVKFFMDGQMVDANRNPIGNMYLVVDSKEGGHRWYYCADDNLVFAINATCPTCGHGVPCEKPRADLQPEGVVQTTHSHF